MLSICGMAPDGRFLQNLSLEQVRAEPLAWYWVDFDRPQPAEEQLLDSFFHFHPLAIEDTLQFLQRAKMDFYEGYVFFVTHSIHSETFDPEEINLFVGANYVVTFHRHPLDWMGELRFRLASGEKPLDWENQPMQIAYHVIDRLVDSYFPHVYEIEDALNVLEDEMESGGSQAGMRRVFNLRSDLLHLRRIILPMRELLYRMDNADRLALQKNERSYFRDIYDHLLKLSEMVDSNREMTADMRENFMARNSSRINRITMMLTILSAVFIPQTFIAGVYGMNFDYMPFLRVKGAYYITLGAMALISVGMLAWFRSKGWFDVFKDK